MVHNGPNLIQDTFERLNIGETAATEGGGPFVDTQVRFAEDESIN